MGQRGRGFGLDLPASRLIKQHNPTIPQDSTRKSKQLLLPQTKIVQIHLSVYPASSLHSLPHTALLQRLAQCLSRVPPLRINVPRNTLVEAKRFLRDDIESRADRRGPDGAGVEVVDADGGPGAQVNHADEVALEVALEVGLEMEMNFRIGLAPDPHLRLGDYRSFQ